LPYQTLHSFIHVTYKVVKSRLLSILDKRVKTTVISFFHFSREEAGWKFIVVLMIGHAGTALAMIGAGIGTSAFH